MLLLLSLNIIRVEEVFELAKWEYNGDSDKDADSFRSDLSSNMLETNYCTFLSHQANVRISARALQSTVPGSQQRSNRKRQKTRQSSLTNILQHIINGQASALSLLT